MGSGPNIKTAIAILNCLLARQLCFEDASCSAILEIIPRVCGPELVACSTVTVTKCQAALRTLQAFPFFKPTCLCKEPHVDRECNKFRDFLFDHPCLFVLKKEKDPYPVDALPTCNHALSVCQLEKKCIRLFEDYKGSCKVRDNRCRMDDRETCHEAWSNLRLSPMFGCICPNNHMKRRCDRIFTMVNHNPCVVKVMSTSNGKFSLVESQLENPLVEPAHVSGNVIGGSVSHSGIMGQNPANHLSGAGASVVLTHHTNGTLIGEEDPGVLDNASAAQSKHIDAVYPDANEELTRNMFQSTCHIALASCRSEPACRGALQPVLLHCDAARCSRRHCMDALQAFYRTQGLSWRMDVAFCWCKKTSDRADECMLAQERLHPVCARRPEPQPNGLSGGVIVPPAPACHTVAETCREQEECRGRLEMYEQSCAVDSVTKKCAGPASECRVAMLGILGTELRTTCACKGADLAQLFECLGWQRLLWINPCVVASQKEFHIQRLEEAAPWTTSTVTTTVTFPETTTARLIITAPAIERIIPVTEPQVKANVEEVASEAEMAINLGGYGMFGAAKESTTTITSTTTKTTTTTTTTPATSTIPPRYCVVQRPNQSDQYIREGNSKRLFREDEPECSELCHCDMGESLTCHTLCVSRTPCRTDFAYYSHAAPAYQAYRGRCLCYSGRFICMRPPPGEYTLPRGVFLFLGYSATDEALLRPHTELGVLDAVRALQDLAKTSATTRYIADSDNMIDDESSSSASQTPPCTLTLFNVTGENVIMAGRIPNSESLADVSPMVQHLREKEYCSDLLHDISDKINQQDAEFSSHLLLSIFKMAEVEEVAPVISSSVNLKFTISHEMVLMSVLLSMFGLFKRVCSYVIELET